MCIFVGNEFTSSIGYRKPIFNPLIGSSYYHFDDEISHALSVF
jgi:hypothetical protein